LSYIYQTWLPKSDERLAAPLVMEYHGKGWEGRKEDGAESAPEWELRVPIA
jgi:hypothetical protein